MKNFFPKRSRYFLLKIYSHLKRVFQWLFSSSEASPYTGRYMTALEKAELLSTKFEGIMVNGKLRLEKSRSFKHMSVIGSTGSGKSSVIFLPYLLALDSPCFILDCSGSLFSQTARHFREKKGFKVLKLDFSDPERSIGYNPLIRADTDSKRKRLAATIIETTLGSSSADPFWAASARQVLYVLIRCMAEFGKSEHNTMHSLRYLVNNLSYDSSCPTSQWIIHNACRETFIEFRAILGTSEKVFGSILSSVKASLELFTDKNISKITSHDTLGDLSRLRLSKTALYICIDETSISYLNTIVSLFLGDILEMAMKMPTKKELDYHMLLDEFAHFKINNISTCLTTLRKRRVAVTLSMQSRSQLEHKYGTKDAESILSGGTASKLILPGYTGDSLSHLFGQHLVKYKGQDLARPLLTMDELYCLKNEALFLHAGYRPAKLRLHPFYKNKHLLALTKKKILKFRRRKIPPLSVIPLEQYTSEKKETSTIEISNS